MRKRKAGQERSDSPVVSDRIKRLRRCSRRGSLLVLCVTMLVVIALLGLSFLQQVRMDAFSSIHYERDYMELVINGILGKLGGILQEDVVVNRENYEPLYDYPWTSGTREWIVRLDAGNFQRALGSPDNRLNKSVSNPVHEPYDDPWLASTVPLVTGSLSEPKVHWMHLTNVNGIWLDLPSFGSADTTPINEEVINGNDAIRPYQDRDFYIPVEDDNNQGGLAGRYQGSSNYEIRGVDADGDGILDSRWTWAPESVRNLGGRKYVMALRVVDLSSLLNVNTAGWNRVYNWGYDYEYEEWAPINRNTPGGYTPVEIDLSKLFTLAAAARIAMPDDDWKRELRILLRKRTKLGENSWVEGFTGFNSGLDWLDLSLDFRQREALWLDQACLYGNTDTNYLIDNELELRYGGGLNRSEANTMIENGPWVAKTSESPVPIPSEANGLGRLLRNDYHYAHDSDGSRIPPEGTWDDVDDVGNMHDWFYGCRAYLPGQTLPGDCEWNTEDRKYPAIRHMLTTASGSSVYQQSYGGSGIQPSQISGVDPARMNLYEIKYDLGYAAASLDALASSGYQASTKEYWWQTPQEVFVEIASRLNNVFQHARHNEQAQLPDWYRRDKGLRLPRLGPLIVEYTLAMMDYMDANSIPFAYYNNGDLTNEFFDSSFHDNVTYCGMEALPFIREAYIQAAYEDADPGDPFASPDPVDGKWRIKDKSQAMAVDIGNPFPRRINTERVDHEAMLKNLRLSIYHDDESVPQSSFELGHFLDSYVAAHSAPNDDKYVRMQSFDPDNPLDPGDSLVLYFNPLNPGIEGDERNDLKIDQGWVSTYEHEITEEEIVFQDSDHILFRPYESGVTDSITIALEVNTYNINTGQYRWIAYDRITLDDTLYKYVPEEQDHDPPDPSVTPATATVEPHIQISMRRDDVYSRYMSNKGLDLESNARWANGESGNPLPVIFDPANLPADYKNDISALGDDSNCPDCGDRELGDTPMVDDYVRYGVQIPIADRQCYSLAELGGIFMFGFTDQDTGDFPRRFSGTNGSGGLPDWRYYLDIDDDPIAWVPSSDNPDIQRSLSGLPYGAMVFDMFTTVSPKRDRRDNDNDDGNNYSISIEPGNIEYEKYIDNAEERFVPGTININTMPLHLLTLSSPLPEPLDDIEALMRTIVYYRDAPFWVNVDSSDGILFVDEKFEGATSIDFDEIRSESSAVTRISGMRRVRPGIASIGELLYLRPDGDNRRSAYNMQRYGYDEGKTQVATVLDQYPNYDEAYDDPRPTDDDPEENGIIRLDVEDGQEEALSRYQYFPQAYSVRSDRYAVYGVVRGYNPARYHEGPMEESRFIAIIDRGELVEDTDMPKVIGFVRLQ